MATILLAGIIIGLILALIFRPKPQAPTIIYVQPDSQPGPEPSIDLGCLPWFAAVAGILMILFLNLPPR